MQASASPKPSGYRGRFAPSPTGPLHFGSLICAVGSYLQARSQQGQWLLRIEDIDRARERRGAANAILRTLEAFDLHWDEPVIYQSQRLALYNEALQRLSELDYTYPCSCSRKDIQAVLNTTDQNAPYPGTCRAGLSPGKTARAIRLKTNPGAIAFFDSVQGHFSQDLAHDVGDFILRRADGFYAYQLAVVIDDADQGITEVVRGADLLDNTPRQILLQRLLNLPSVDYLHLPVVTDESGAKLSKQTLAAPINNHQPLPTLKQALRFLGHDPPALANLDELWQWAIEHWRIHQIPQIREIPISSII